MIGDAKQQGFWAAGTNDAYIGGKPDFRCSRLDLGQTDIELKILRCQQATWDRGLEVLSGIRKLQEIEMRDMNKAGAIAFGAVLVQCAGVFIFTNFQRVDLKRAKAFGSVPYVHRPKNVPCVDVEELVWMGRKYLETLT